MTAAERAIADRRYALTSTAEKVLVSLIEQADDDADMPHLVNTAVGYATLLEDRINEVVTATDRLAN
jgi:hypothetical protein